MALDELLYAPQLVILRGDTANLPEWQQSLHQVYQPRRLVFAIPAGAPLPTTLSSKAVQPTTVAYVCQGMTCGEPVTSLQALIPLTR